MVSSFWAFSTVIVVFRLAVQCLYCALCVLTQRPSDGLVEHLVGTRPVMDAESGGEQSKRCWACAECVILTVSMDLSVLD